MLEKRSRCGVLRRIQEGNTCQPEFSYFFLSAGVATSPFMSSLFSNVVTSAVISFCVHSSLLCSPTPVLDLGFQPVPLHVLYLLFFFFFTTVMWCWPRPPRKPLLLHLIHISGCTLLYPPCSHLLMRLARCTVKIHFMSRICRFTQQKLWADCREALLSAGTASMTESVEC